MWHQRELRCDDSGGDGEVQVSQWVTVQLECSWMKLRIQEDGTANLGGQNGECGNGTERCCWATDILRRSHRPPFFLFFFLSLPSSRNNLSLLISRLVRRCHLLLLFLVAPVLGLLAARVVLLPAVLSLPATCTDRSTVHYSEPSLTRVLLRQLTPMSWTAR